MTRSEKSKRSRPLNGKPIMNTPRGSARKAKRYMDRLIKDSPELITR